MCLPSLYLAVVALLGSSPIQVMPQVRDVPGFAGSGRVQVCYRLEMGGAHALTPWTYFPGDTLATGWQATPQEFSQAIDLLLDPAVTPVDYDKDFSDFRAHDSPVRRALVERILASREMRAYLGGRNALGRRLRPEDLHVTHFDAVGIALVAVGDTAATCPAIDDTLRLGKFACLARYALSACIERNRDLPAGEKKTDVVFLVPSADIKLPDVGWTLTGVTVSFGIAGD